MNQTAIVNGNVTFKCPVVSDIAAHITWAKYFALNDNDTDTDLSQANKIRFQVYTLNPSKNSQWIGCRGGNLALKT